MQSLATAHENISLGLKQLFILNFQQMHYWNAMLWTPVLYNLISLNINGDAITEKPSLQWFINKNASGTILKGYFL